MWLSIDVPRRCSKAWTGSSRQCSSISRRLSCPPTSTLTSSLASWMCLLESVRIQRNEDPSVQLCTKVAGSQMSPWLNMHFVVRVNLPRQRSSCRCLTSSRYSCWRNSQGSLAKVFKTYECSLKANMSMPR